MPVALSRFAAKAPKDHETQLWLGLLRQFHGLEKHAVKDWYAMIDRLKSRPVPRT